MKFFGSLLALSLALTSAHAQFYEGCGEVKNCFGVDLGGAEGCIETEVGQYVFFL